MKHCPTCGEDKPVALFGRNKALPDGLSFYCLECNRVRNRRWYRESRARQGHQVRDVSWVPKGFRWCPMCEQAVEHQQYTRSRNTSHGFGSRCKACASIDNSDSYFYRKYGLTRRAVDELRAEQDNRCGVCRRAGPGHLDHDHLTGALRGFLCQGCNQGLGQFRDDPAVLRAAADYVEFHRGSQTPEESPPQALQQPAGRRKRLSQDPARSERLHRGAGSQHEQLIAARLRGLLAPASAPDVD